MNPYDEFAVEQSLLHKTAHPGSTVTVIRVGQSRNTEILRTALAMGADSGILVETSDLIDSYMTALAIKAAIKKSEKNPDIIFTGKQAIDSDCLQVPQLLAQMLNLPSVTMVVDVVKIKDPLVVKREIEGGSCEIYSYDDPVVIACNKGLNTPRYASLPGIMKAKRKSLQVYSLEELKIDESHRKVRSFDFQLPPEKPPGKLFDCTDESTMATHVKTVASLLRHEAKII